MGLQHALMLTGDHATIAQSIATDVGIDEVHGGLLPKDKVDILRSIKKKMVDHQLW